MFRVQKGMWRALALVAGLGMATEIATDSRLGAQELVRVIQPEQMTTGEPPIACFALSDAIYAPLAARQVVRARQADWRTAANDSFLAVAEAYFNVEQAQGELAGAADAVQRAESLLGITEQLAKPGVQIIQP